MLKKLTATGILAGAATGIVLLGCPAHADRLADSPSSVSDIPAACVSIVPGFVPPTWCNSYLPDPYYPPTTYYPPVTYYPGYNYGGNGWNHGGWGGGHWGGGHGGGHWGGGHGGGHWGGGHGGHH
jgi:hypothetical protein